MSWHEMTAAEVAQAVAGAFVLWAALVVPLCF